MADTTFFDYVIGLKLDSTQSEKKIKDLRIQMSQLERHMQSLHNKDILRDILVGASGRMNAEIQRTVEQNADIFAKMSITSQKKIQRRTDEISRTHNKLRVDAFAMALDEEVKLVQDTENKKNRMRKAGLENLEKIKDRPTRSDDIIARGEDAKSNLIVKAREELLENTRRINQDIVKSGEQLVSTGKKELSLLRAKSALIAQGDKKVNEQFKALGLVVNKHQKLVRSLKEETQQNKLNAQHWLNMNKAVNQASAENNRRNTAGGALGVSFLGKIFNLTAITRYLVVYRAAIAVMRGLQKAARDAVTTTIELDRIQGQIAKVLPVQSRNQDNLNNITQEAINIAKRYGTSITETAESMTLLFQQGLKQEEVFKRTESAIRLATVSTLELSKAVEIQTSFLKVYGSELKNAETLTDALLGVESKHAITAGTLAEAFLGTASAAEEMGVSFEQLLGMITAIGVRTRDTGNKIGTAIRFILPRLISKEASSTLSTAGVNVFGINEEGILQSRRMGSVLDDLTIKWGTLGKTQREYIATIVAGRRRLNSFITMMNSMAEEGIPATIAALTSAGRSMEAAEIITNRLDKQIGKFGASWKEYTQAIGKTWNLKEAMSLAIDYGNAFLKIGIAVEDVSNKITTFSGVLLDVAKKFQSVGPVNRFIFDIESKEKEELLARKSAFIDLAGGVSEAVGWFSKFSQAADSTTASSEGIKLLTLLGSKLEELGIESKKVEKFQAGLAKALVNRVGLSNEVKKSINEELKEVLELQKDGLHPLSEEYGRLTKLQDGLSKSVEVLDFNISALKVTFTEIDQITSNFYQTLFDVNGQMDKLEKIGRATSSSYTDAGMKTSFYEGKLSEIQRELEKFDLTTSGLGPERVTKAQYNALQEVRGGLSGTLLSPDKSIDDLLRDLLGGKSIEDISVEYYGKSLQSTDNNIQNIKKVLTKAQEGLSVTRDTDIFRRLSTAEKKYLDLTRTTVDTELSLTDKIAQLTREYKKNNESLKNQEVSSTRLKNLEIEYLKDKQKIEEEFSDLSERERQDYQNLITDLLYVIDLEEDRLQLLKEQNNNQLRYKNLDLIKERGQSSISVFAATNPDVSTLLMEYNLNQKIFELRKKLIEEERSKAKDPLKIEGFNLKLKELEIEKNISGELYNRNKIIEGINKTREKEVEALDKALSKIKDTQALSTLGVTSEEELFKIRIDSINKQKLLLTYRYAETKDLKEKKNINRSLIALMLERLQIQKQINLNEQEYSKVNDPFLQRQKIREEVGTRKFPKSMLSAQINSYSNILNRDMSNNLRLLGVGVEVKPEEELKIKRQVLITESNLLSKELERRGVSQETKDIVSSRLLEIRKELFAIQANIKAEEIYLNLTEKQKRIIRQANLKSNLITGLGEGTNRFLQQRKSLEQDLHEARMKRDTQRIRQIKHELKQMDSIWEEAIFSGLGSALPNLTTLVKDKLKVVKGSKAEAEFALALVGGSVLGGAIGGGGGRAQTGAGIGSLAGLALSGGNPLGAAIGGALGGAFSGMLDDTKEALIDNTLALRENTQTLENLNERILGAPAGFTLPAGASTGFGIAGTGGSVIVIDQNQLVNVIRNAFGTGLPKNNNLA